MSKNPQSASYPPAPATEAALRKSQYEKDTLQDGIWIIGGIFIALIFIGIASYIVRYVASRPSNTLVSGETIGLSSPKEHPIIGKLIKNKNTEAGKCEKLDGKAFKIKPGKSITAYFRGNIGNKLAFELINVPELSNCPYEMLLSSAQARIAMGLYTQEHQVADTIAAALPTALPFTEEDMKSADTDDKSLLEEENNSEADSDNSAKN